MFRPNHSFLTRVAVGITLTTFCAPVLAQDAPRKAETTAKKPVTKRSVMDLLRYDPERSGPLLFIPDGWFALRYDDKSEKYARETAGGKTPAQFAEQIQRRVIAAGGITAIVPRTMREIEKNPGKPDPFAGLTFEQRLTLVLATFTREQWKQASGANGIGLTDLTDDQRSTLIAGQHREKEMAKIRTYDTGKDGRSILREPMDSVAVSELRFRLSRRVMLRLQPVGTGDGFSHRPDHYKRDVKGEDGSDADGSYTYQYIEMPREAADVEGTVSAFGVPIVKTVPNRLKSGHLALDSPALKVGMVLDGSHQTVGELLAAVAKTTRLPLTADKRLATLPVVYRLTPGGQVASAGDVLEALCRSVTSTFRRLDGPNGARVYLLTDDVEGIGTRLARLDRWAEKASQQRRDAEWKALEDCADSEPLDSLGFAPDYAFALSPAQLKKLDDAYRSPAFERGTLLPVSQLSPALQEEIKNSVASYRESKPSAAIRTDTVGINTEFECEWVAPGGRAFPALGFESAMSFDFLHQVAVPRSKRTAARGSSRYKNPAPTKFPLALKRRIVTVTLPESEDDTKALFTLLSRKGFNEAWFRVGDATPATRERLRTALALGKAATVRVGVVIPWLMKADAGAKSPLDVNLLGETGAELVEAELASVSDKKLLAAARANSNYRDAGWVVPDARDVPAIVETVSPFVKIAGLSAVAFTNSAALGYHDPEPGLGYATGTFMGYSNQLRFRCVAEEGFDPVDVSEHNFNLRVSDHPPFFRLFRVDGNRVRSRIDDDLARFRLATNKAHLARIHDALRKDFPKTLFYLDDGGRGPFKFYGRWAKPEGFPAIGERNASDAKLLRGVAFRNDPAPIYTIQGALPEYTDSHFWNAWHGGTKESANGWAGFSLNLLTHSLEDVTAVLSLLPDDARPGK